jgi:glycosyltransferase involved in cell wall biosynthesis
MTANSNLPRVSVVIPTHNPRENYLARVLDALRTQTLPREQWELVVVDNGSRVPLKAGVVAVENRKGGRWGCYEETEQNIDLSWHSNARIVREERLGLTFARLRGFAEAKGELIVMVDDDNVLAPDYLETAVRIAAEHPMLGAFGGKCLPEFEHEPPHWLKGITSGLGLRDRGEREEFFPQAAIAGSWQLADGSWQGGENGRLTTEDGKLRLTEFPDCAPIGAGMVLRRDAAAAYAASLRARGVRLDGVSEGQCFSSAVENTDLLKNRRTESPQHRPAAVITDRKGDSLASGGDNDICLTSIEEGWQVGYLPHLQLTHLIPWQRMTLDYHQRMARDSMKSFILMLDQHGIRPWPAMAKWTVPLRVASDWWRVRPWLGAEQSLRFWGHVGMYEGRASLERESS